MTGTNQRDYDRHMNRVNALFVELSVQIQDINEANSKMIKLVNKKLESFTAMENSMLLRIQSLEDKAQEHYHTNTNF